MMNTTCPRGPGRRAMPLSLAAIAATGVLMLSACASTPPPNAELAVSTAAVAHAVGAGAPELAPAEMRSARDKLDRANSAFASRDYEAARNLAEQARVDALLAEAKSESTKATRAADAMAESNRVLRQEMARKPL
jgi:hypothetical protein